MIHISLEKIAEITDGEIPWPEFSDVVIEGIAYDSRKVEPGNLYVPLPGERVNGHAYIQHAFEEGAAATLYEESEPEPEKPMPCVIVPDGVFAMQALATWYMKQLDCKVVGITGNNGKTMTKDITAALLSDSYETVKTAGNQNNEIGLPYTVLHLPEDTEIAVLEMGTERLGEIHTLTAIAKPDVAVILNVGDAHLDFLLNEDNAATAKLEMAENMTEDGILFYNGDDPWLKKHLHDAVRVPRLHSFGMEPGNDTVFEVVETSSEGVTIRLSDDPEDTYTLPALGAHNAWNLAASVLMAKELGVTEKRIQTALPQVNYTSMRQELKHLEGFDILDDSYKSNTQSLAAALETLHMLPYHYKIVVLADFLGTGDDEIEKHVGMKKYLTEDKVDVVITTGPLMKHLHDALVNEYPEGDVLHFALDERDALIRAAIDAVVPGSVVLVKGSRDFALEDVVKGLESVEL